MPPTSLSPLARVLPGRIRRQARALAVCALAAACGGPEPAPSAATAGEPAPALAAAPSEGNGFGEGFLVWESNRSGRWRLWIRPLDARRPRQLSRDEGARRHCCPHISPDGRWIAYLSLPPGPDRYPEKAVAGELRLIPSAGGEERVLAGEAINYFENRAAVWRDDRELIYIGADRRTRLLELEGGRSRVLVADPPGEHGWLINGALTRASTGFASFSPYEPGSRSIAERTPLAGCQPYFSHDGRWGYWTAGAGGPINRIEFASGEVSTVLRKGDPRVTEGLGYAYFPMYSRDGMLFSWAASDGEHDHFRGDYEVFVAESDPRTLELVGPPRRMTFHPGSDRFPDVWLAPLALGRHFGEVPFEVRVTPGGGGWEWDFGDGQVASGSEGRHIYRRAGSFELTARRRGEVLRGRVAATPPRPPRPLSVSLRAAGRELVVRFDEEIAADSASASLESGLAVVERTLSEDRRGLVLRLAGSLTSFDRLRLEGVTDRAGRPNLMAPASLEVEPPLWPARREGLAFIWETADAPNLVEDRELGVERSCVLQPAGRAYLSHAFAMVLGRGAFVAAPELAPRVSQSCRATNELSLEMLLGAERQRLGRPGRIVSLSRAGRGPDLYLDQRGERLVLGMRIGSRGPEAVAEASLLRLPAGRPVHLVVTYEPGRLRAFLDGEPAATDDSIRGDFFHWRATHLTFGDQWGGGADWPGTLEGVAIYNRLLDAAEARENFLRVRSRLERRPEVARTVIVARLERRSRVPSLEEITPYREALAVSEYRVLEVVEGELAADRVRVAEWVIMDGERLPAAASGGRTRLVVEPFAANPQLESVVLSDTLGGSGGELFFAVGG